MATRCFQKAGILIRDGYKSSSMDTGFLCKLVTVHVLGKLGPYTDRKNGGSSIERLVVVTPDLHPQIGP